MIKTLRITSVITALTGAGLFAFLGFFGFRSGDGIEQFLSTPSAIERFKRAQGGQTRTGGDQEFPLVKQAALFANYLNPPAKPRPERPRPIEKGEGPDQVIEERIQKHYFNLIATCVNLANPADSVALIDEPAKGQHWVRQSGSVGHLVFERIEDGRVILRGGKGTSQVSVQRPPEISLIDGGAASGPVSSAASLAPESDQAALAAVTQSPVGSGARQEVTAEERALADKIFEELEALANKRAKGGDLAGGKPEGASTGKIVSVPESGRITGDEAEQLEDLGKELENIRQDANRAEVRSKGRPDQRVRRDWRERRNQMLKARAERARARAKAKQDSTAEP